MSYVHHVTSKWLCELVLVTGTMKKVNRLRDSGDEKEFSTREERRGGLEDIPHQNEWTDEKKKDDMSILDRYCCAQDVAGDGMGNGESKCSSIRSAASYIFLETHVTGRRGRERGMRTDPTHSTRWKHMRAHRKKRRRGGHCSVLVGGCAGTWRKRKEGRRTRRQRKIQQQPYWPM